MRFEIHFLFDNENEKKSKFDFILTQKSDDPFYPQIQRHVFPKLANCQMLINQ